MPPACRRAVQTAELYGDLVETAFDVHPSCSTRPLAGLRRTGPDEESRVGVRLAAYLRRGTAPSDLMFASA